MRNLILSSLVLGLVACGGNTNNAAPASDPSTSSATSSGSSAKPDDTKASPEGKCGAPKAITASSLDACKAECEPLSDKAPEGSRCLPEKTQCKMNCDTKFKPAK